MYTEKQIDFIRRQAESKTEYSLHQVALYASAYGKILAGNEANLTKEELAFLTTLWGSSWPTSFDKERNELSADVAVKVDAITAEEVKP
jgi:hypothetical protein